MEKLNASSLSTFYSNCSLSPGEGDEFLGIAKLERDGRGNIRMQKISHRKSPVIRCLGRSSSLTLVARMQL